MGWFRSTSSSSEAAAAVQDPLAGVGPGVPGRCPSCDGLGYIDNLDLGHRFQIQHCKDCGHRWEYLFDADGHVVGITELDEEGQPVARMRVRGRPLAAERPAAPEAPAPADAAPPIVLSEPPAAPAEVVIDLRAPVEAADEAGSAPEQMSPAEWLRHSLRR